MKYLIAISCIIGCLALTLSISFFIILYALEETDLGNAIRLKILTKLSQEKYERNSKENS